MINLGSSKFETNIIFLQPTHDCGKHCDGCYSLERARVLGNNNMSTTVWMDLIYDLLMFQSKIATQQVTLALDTLNRDKDEPSKRARMLTIAYSYLTALLTRKKDIETHITVNCVSDLKEYTKAFDRNGFDNLSMLSVSNINSPDEVKELRKFVPGARINWNVMSGTFTNKPIEKIKAIMQVVDSAYVLLHKAPLGQTGHNLKDFFSALNKAQELKEPEVKVDAQTCAIPGLLSKINLDGCMNDARNFNKSGAGCASNISRFQIWPDGKVTGCAYNSQLKYDDVVPQSLDEIVNNLKLARSRYEFNSCTIPNNLKNYNPKLNVIT